MNKTLVLSLTMLSMSAFAGSPKDDITKPLKTVVNSVRYSKDLTALKNFAGEEQGKFLVGEQWAKGTDAQRKEFQELFFQLFGKMAFPKIRASFENLDTVLYDEPTVNGDSAEIASTILINHPLKKQELKVKYKVAKIGGAWKVVDVSVLGDSMLKGIRDDQIIPIMKEGESMKEGAWGHLLDLMKAKNAELKEVLK